MSYEHDDDDSSSYCYSDYQSLPEGMTEEESMEIWMRRSREIEERLQRERQLERDMASMQIRAEAVPRGGESEWSDDDSRQGARSRHSASPDGSESTSGLPPEVPAYLSNSAAWRAATTENIMGPYDPSYHVAWMLCQRFIEMNRPGMSEAYIASTPGLARLLEQQREVMRREQERERVRREQQERLEALEAQRQREALEATQRQRSNYADGGTSAGAQGNYPWGGSNVTRRDYMADNADNYHDDLGWGAEGSHQYAGLAEQAREYERLNQAHRMRRANDVMSNSPAAAPAAAPASAATANLDRGSQSANHDTNEKEAKGVQGFYLALPHPTEYLTKPVICHLCRANLYTHPLAQNYMCQGCCKVSSLVYAGAYEGMAQRLEEKMADRGDFDEDRNMEF